MIVQKTVLSSVFLSDCYWGYQNKKSEMGGRRRTCDEGKRCIEGLSGDI